MKPESLDSKRSERYFFGLAERPIWFESTDDRSADGDGGRGDRGTDPSPRSRTCWRSPSSSGTRRRPSSGSTPGCSLVIDRGRLLHLRRRGQAPHRRPPQRRHLQPGPPQPRGGRRGDAAMQRFDIGNRRLPEPGPHRPGRSAGEQRLRGLSKAMYGSGAAGHRHRAEERQARDAEARHRLGGQGLPRAHRAGRGHLRRAVRDLFLADCRRSPPMSCSTTSTRWRRRSRPGTWRR